jgi:hypothetical protein
MTSFLTDHGVKTIAVSDLPSGVGSGPRPSLGNWHYFNVYPQTNKDGSSVFVSQTLQLEAFNVANFSSAPTATEAALCQFASASGTPAQSGVDEVWSTSTSKTPVPPASALNDWQARVKTDLASQPNGDRYWIGLTDDANATPISAGDFATDTPTSNMIAWRWSAGTDTNWQAYVGSGTPLIVDTGVIPDTTASHVFEIQFSGGNALFYYDGVLKATVSTSAVTGNLRSVLTADNIVNSGSTGTDLHFSWLYWESKF